MSTRTLIQSVTQSAARASRLWAWPTTLSLNAPIVAVTWQVLFAQSVGVMSERHHIFILFTAVWLAYSADRWLDSRRTPDPAILRRSFYRRYSKRVASIWLVVCLLSVAVALWSLTSQEFMNGVLLLLVTLTYLLNVHLRQPTLLPKEAHIGLIFAAGVTLFVWPQRPSWPLLLACALFAALCFINCGFIARWERASDGRHQEPSLARRYPRLTRALPRLAHALGLGGLAAALYTPNLGPLFASISLSAWLLYLLHRASPQLNKDACRTLADAALLTPLIPLVLSLLY